MDPAPEYRLVIGIELSVTAALGLELGPTVLSSDRFHVYSRCLYYSELLEAGSSKNELRTGKPGVGCYVTKY